MRANGLDIGLFAARVATVFSMVFWGTVVCSLFGPLLGTLVLALGVGVLSGRLDVVAATPMMALFGGIATAPFGAAAGAIGSLLASALGIGRLRDARTGVWMVAGAGSGGLLGAMCPLFLASAGWGLGEGAALPYALLGAASGLWCGGVIGALGRLHFGIALPAADGYMRERTGSDA